MLTGLVVMEEFSKKYPEKPHSKTKRPQERKKDSK
jgi:hypothetical protein